MNLDSMITITAEMYKQRQRDESEQRKVAEQTAREAEVKKLYEELRGEFGEELWAALSPKVDHRSTEIDAVYQGVPVKIRLSSAGPKSYYVYAYLDGDSVDLTNTLGGKGFSGIEKLPERVLLALALLRDRFVPEHIEVRHQWQEEARAIREKQDALKVEHERIQRDIIQPAIVKALDDAWKWPKGVTITLYKVTYVTGVVSTEDGEIYSETHTVWTDRDCAADEWWTVRDGVYRERTIRLDAQAHKPVWERFAVSSIDELARLDIPGAVEWRRNVRVNGVSVEDGKFYVERPDGWVSVQSEEYAFVCEWIKLLINAASA